MLSACTITSVDFLPYDARGKVRHGTTLLGTNANEHLNILPKMTDRDGVYSISQTLQVVTKTAGPDFSVDDVGNWIHWEAAAAAPHSIAGGRSLEAVCGTMLLLASTAGELRRQRRY